MGILYAAFLRPCFFRKGRLLPLLPPSFTGLMISAVPYFALCSLLCLFLFISSTWTVSCLLFLFPLYPLCFLSAVLSFSFVLFSAVLNFTYFIPLGCLPLLAFIHPVFRPLRRLLPTFLRHSTLLLCFSLSPLTLFSMHIFQCKVCIELIVTKFSHMAYN